MGRVITAFLLALGQLADRRILAVLLKTVAITFVIFAVLGWAGFYGLEYLIGETGLLAGSEIAGLLTIALTFLAAWLLFRVVALAVLQFSADEIVLAVEDEHYPEAGHTLRKLPFAEELSNSIKSTVRVVLVNLAVLPIAVVLLITGFGAPLLFWAVNAVLLGRELQDMVWLRHRRTPDEQRPLSGLTRFILGGIVAALLLIPFINFLAPILGAAAATHLVHRNRINAHA